MTPLCPGATFSHYRIVGTLGQGGQATAFKAEDLRLCRPVVVKTLKPELASSETARRRFEREAALASAIDNPHIQAVYDVGETDDGTYYIVLQYVEGQTLKQFMGGRPLDTLSALSLAIQLADALAVAHATGIAHRDLKPANIIVGPGGQAKILDFGLAKMLAPEVADGTLPPRTDDPLTEVGVPYGSMGYGSPEQAAGQAADHRTDVFSLGVVLYEMVTGQPPFRGRHAVEVLNAVINAQPRPIHEANPRALPLLQPILDRALAKDPKGRFQTMAAFRDALKALMRRLTRETGLVPTDATATLAAPQHARGGWLLAGTLGRVLGRLRTGAVGLRDARSGTPPGPASPPRPPSWGSEERPTLAVLPFRNLAGNPEAAFYEFALADGVITELANVKSLIVRPSAYVAPYVGQTVDPRQVGEELATRLVLAGGFIRTPERMRVTAQLLETATGQLLWSDRIDLATRDLLDVQDEIAERLLAGLKLRLTAEEQRRIDLPLTSSPEAYEFYLRARDALFRYILRTHEEVDLDEAVRLLHEAIGLDPQFARAHATLGRCYVLYAQGWGGSESYVLAERSLKLALALEPTIVNARLQMVYVDLHQGDKDRAHARIDELLREAPDDPSVLFVAAMLHRLDGLYGAALRLYDRLLAVNPKDTVLVSFNKARIYTHQGLFDEALAEIEKGRAVEPEHPLLKTFLAVALFNHGLLDEAQALLQDVLRQNPHFDGLLPLVAWCLSARGRHEQARALISDRVREIASADPDIALWLASFYAMEGLLDQSLEWVRLAVRIGNENYPLLTQTAKLVPLHSDPRFIELVEELRQRWERRVSAHPEETDQ